MVKRIMLEPQYFGASIREILQKRLSDAVEGQSLGKYGYCINVCEVDLENVGLGEIDEDSGCAVFTLKYVAILFRPFRGEVLDAIVKTVNEGGITATVGPLKVFVHGRTGLPMDFEFSSDTCSWISEDRDEIKIGSYVRLRLMGVNIEAASMGGIATLKDDYMGLSG